MTTIALIAHKGGVGKTTLATNLGAALASPKNPWALLDLDPQSSALLWREVRANEAERDYFDVIAVNDDRLEEVKARADGIGFSTILDTPPSIGPHTTDQIRLADLILIPCRASMYDINTLEHTAKLLGALGKQGHVILNTAQPNSRKIGMAMEAVSDLGLGLCPRVIYRRAAVEDSAALGKTLQEYEPTGRAAHEFAAMASWVKQQIAQ